MDVTVRTIARWTKEKRIPYVKHGDRIRYRRSAMIALAARRSVVTSRGAIEAAAFRRLRQGGTHIDLVIELELPDDYARELWIRFHTPDGTPIVLPRVTSPEALAKARAGERQGAARMHRERMAQLDADAAAQRAADDAEHVKALRRLRGS